MVRKIISILTFILMAFVVWEAKDQILMAFNYLQDMNIIVVLMLIPEQLFMYYCCGQMFFSYMRAKGDSKNMSRFDLFRISLELNFMNHAVPSGGVSGLGYIAWRLKPYGASYGETSFMYLLRYAITISTNQLQTIIAIIFLISQGELTDSMSWILGVVAAACFAIFLVIVAIVVIASSRKRIDWFAKIGTQFVNWFVNKVTFGHRPKILELKTVQSYFRDIHKNLMDARKNKSILVKPMLWGVVYSFLEVATYWVVSISMGHPELLPSIMVAEAIGSVVGGIVATPGGIGGYEGSMIGIMTMLGVDIGLATADVITTRVIVLVLTVGSGYGFYQHAVSKIGKKDRAEIERINEENPLD